MNQEKSHRNYHRHKDRLYDTDIMIEATQEALTALRDMGYKIPREPMPYTSFYHVKLPKGKKTEQALMDFEQLGVSDGAEFNLKSEEAWVPNPSWPGFV